MLSGGRAILARVLPTPNNLERARLVGDLHDSRLHAHVGRSVAVDTGVGALGSLPRNSAAWTLGLILTRHGTGHARSHKGDWLACARVIELRRTALTGMNAEQRLSTALMLPCTCGAGSSKNERLSLTNKKEKTNNGTTLRTPSFYI